MHLIVVVAEQTHACRGMVLQSQFGRGPRREGPHSAAPFQPRPTSPSRAPPEYSPHAIVCQFSSLSFSVSHSNCGFVSSITVFPCEKLNSRGLVSFSNGLTSCGCTDLGVLVWTALQTNNYKQNPFYEQVKNERGYRYEVWFFRPDRNIDFSEDFSDKLLTH